jgi:hypothetical protein
MVSYITSSWCDILQAETSAVLVLLHDARLWAHDHAGREIEHTRTGLLSFDSGFGSRARFP